ncbi:MAG: hypothetical protein ACYDC3_17380 [Candidatus Binataceae bacterium]
MADQMQGPSQSDPIGRPMNRIVLLAFLASLIVLPACRAPRDSSQNAAPAPVGTDAPAAGSGQPLPDGKMMPIADVLSKYQSQLSPVAFYFDDQPHPAVEKTLGEYISNKKTNAFNKSDAEACQWVALSALMEFRKRAIGEGGNAVINIHSFYKRNDLSDATRYECHAGFAVAGVAFKGTVVKLAK